MIRFSPALLIDGRRLPGTGESLRRMVRALDVQSGERLLLLGSGSGPWLKPLARDAGALVTAFEWEPALVAAAEARARDEGLTARVTVVTGDLDALPSPGFESIVVDALPAPGELNRLVAALRELLVPNGRLGLTLPAAMGRVTAPEVASHWAPLLGAPLVRPTLLLSQLEQAGFEPLWAEAHSDELLAEHYRRVEAALPDADPALAPINRRALELFQSGPGRTGAGFAMLVLRRREPGEKPPPARTAG